MGHAGSVRNSSYQVPIRGFESCLQGRCGDLVDSFIEIRGARTHNLKNVDLDIPRGRLTVLTGVSGSGKTSLAFDTLFAEGQRQYLQSLSSYTRQFVDQMERPAVDSIRGLQPSLCIDQNQGIASPRSTVGTITEIYDYLRLLMARVATPACHACGSPIDRQAPSAIVESILKHPVGTRLTVLAPMVIGRKGAHADVFDRIAKSGLIKAYVDGALVDMEALPVLAVRKEHSIAAVVDRIVLRNDSRERMEHAVQAALRLSNGLIATLTGTAESSTPEIETLYSTRFACVQCGISLPDVEPRTFSFNSAYGACPQCEGFGEVGEEDPQVCPACLGARLKPESLAIRLFGYSIAELAARTIEDLAVWLASLHFQGDKQLIAEPIVKEILPRLDYLCRVGLPYLSLDRSGHTLSGGELQRVRLATSVGTGLIGVCYVLDEPSIGLHHRDTQKLIEILRSLQQRGNTVVVVEHDESMMKAADILVDFGPGAGRQGGQIIAYGPPKKVQRVNESITGRYLIGCDAITDARHRSVDSDHPYLQLFGVTKNNLKQVDARFPIGRLIAITGVSGSGKSTLVHDTLVPALQHHLNATKPTRPHWKKLHGHQAIDRLIEIDQSPIGRSPRSVPATYCGLWDDVRKIFSATRDAKQRGFSATRFSFNSGNGRCEVCAGQGRQKLEMSFLEDVDVPCSACAGKRFNRATLGVRFKGKSISEVLELTVDEATEFFENVDSLCRALRRLQEVGLGYLTLGQRSTTLSGGEAQRLKLANELTRPATGKTLYVLDEPTTGLHMADVDRLVRVLQGLVDRGNTVIVVEHHLDLIRCCDWVIDLGPEGGDQGGQILIEGPPESVAKCDSPTGLALRESLARP
jgi:excinuclease ABC subunit A